MLCLHRNESRALWYPQSWMEPTYKGIVYMLTSPPFPSEMPLQSQGDVDLTEAPTGPPRKILSAQSHWHHQSSWAYRNLFCPSFSEGRGELKCGSLEPSPVRFHSPFLPPLTQGTGLWRQKSGAFQFHARYQWPGLGWPYLLSLLPR